MLTQRFYIIENIKENPNCFRKMSRSAEKLERGPFISLKRIVLTEKWEQKNWNQIRTVSENL